VVENFHHRGGGKNGQSRVPTDDKNDPSNKVIRQYTEERVSSSSEVLPEKAEDGEKKSSLPPNGTHTPQDLQKPAPSYRAFRNAYPPEKLDDAKAHAAFEKLATPEKQACLEGLTKHLRCERWIKAGRYIPLASNFINRQEYAADPPPYLHPTENREKKKAEELADRASKVFERTRRK